MTLNDLNEGKRLIDRVRNHPSHKWWVLGTVGFGIVTGGIDNSMINLAAPRLAAVFGVEADVILWLTAAFMVVAVGLALTWGSLGDSIGRRRVYMAGFLFFAVGIAVMSVSQNVSHLIVGRIIQAVGQSMTVTNGFAIAVAAFPERDRGKVIGLVGAFVGMGLSIGPIFGGYVLEYLDWRALFWTRIPLSLIALGLVALVIRGDRPGGMRRPFDYAGAVTLFLTLSSLLLIINRAPRMGLFSPLILGLAAVMLVAGTLFVIAERRAPMPVVNFGLFRSRFLSMSLAVHYLHFLAIIVMQFLLPFYLLSGRGLPETQAGFLLAVIQVVRLFSAPLSGWATDRLGSRTVASSGIAMATAGFFLMARLPADASIVQIVVSLLLTGVGAAVFDPANEHAVLHAVPASRLASATALTTTARQIGFSMGTAIAGTFYAARIRFYEAVPVGGTASAETVTSSFQEVMLTAVGVMAVALLLSVLRGVERQAPSEGDGGGPEGQRDAMTPAHLGRQPSER